MTTTRRENTMTDTMVTTRSVPWMQLGSILDEDVMSAERAINLGGMDFTVSMQPCFQRVDDEFREIPNRKAVTRDDTSEVFEVVSDGYEILQFTEAFDFLDAINPKFVAVGTLKGGKQGFVVVQAPEMESLKLLGDDHHDMYVVVRTSHDRSRAVEAMIMPLRERCMNQLGLQSFKAGVANRWSIPHTKSMHDKLIVAQDAIVKIDVYADELKKTAERLAAATFSRETGEKLIRRVLPVRPKTDEVVERILHLWQHGETVGYAGNGWGLVNAVSDYFDHGRAGGSAESRFTGALQGVTYKMINSTAALALAA